ncbi:GNAT family N-acetyltransferase [Ruegeria sediminis]|uniref:GNAT family N-acetyltransferase n=2 Tax=Ruegeria sediminis TaxID=2583820 RepID=A0ABY2X4V2_9RHOB|nr:GNAT family N-acetyltransferase [Ruegeria sediminis]
MGPEERALAFLDAVLDPDFALVARNEAGRMLGMAGFKTAQGGLTGGGMADLARVYGWVGGLWRGLALSVLERQVQAGVFQMDGIFVAAEARGRGVGTALLDAVKAEATATGMREVQLDVIDTNPRARALYERQGFSPVGQTDTGPFRRVFGFSSATRMSWPVEPAG